MLADLIGEVVTSIVGEAIWARLFPDSVRPQPSPPEGEWNASLGSLAAFLASIAALFLAIAGSSILRGISDLLLWLFLGGAVALAIVSSVLAHRALEVTQRRRTLAKIGLWLSRAAIVTGLLVAVLSITGFKLPVA
jgi:uncharacterized membrane protein